MFNYKAIAEYASAAMVFISGALAGHYASLGMNLIQGLGAAAAILGSVTLAVVVRVWTPTGEKVRQRQRD
jgi:hypothetical protein